MSLRQITIILIVVFLVLFLTGKIVPIEHGTTQGGIMCAAGTGIILVGGIAIYSLIQKINQHNNSK